MALWDLCFLSHFEYYHLFKFHLFLVHILINSSISRNCHFLLNVLHTTKISLLIPLLSIFGTKVFLVGTHIQYYNAHGNYIIKFKEIH